MKIVIFGPPGVGKTTFGKKIEGLTTNIKFLDEWLDDNPYISSSFNNHSIMFRSSMYFLNAFYNKEIENESNDKIVIFDQGFLELIVYNKALLLEKYLNEEDYKKIEEEYYAKCQDLKPVDLFIYYTVSKELELQRIKSRNRLFEDVYINTNLIDVLRDEYDSFFQTLPEEKRLYVNGDDKCAATLVLKRIKLLLNNKTT